MSVTGKEEGDRCNRWGCSGILALTESENCSCHISPPCGSCMRVRPYCKACGYDSADDQIVNDYVVNVNKETGVYRHWEPRPLDSSKIDWRSHGHTHFSMIKRGVYPPGTTQEDVRKLVDGTFGGRFNSFGGGKFEFVAYTD